MDPNHKERVQAQFGGSAEAYVVSATHAEGDDLDQLVAWAEGGPNRVALDVATGAGHTTLALAPRFERVVASDLTPRMLETAAKHAREVGVGNVEFRQADAEALPFEDASFDLVSCRIAPHHFDDVRAATAEMARVARDRVVVEDNLYFDDASEEAERLRDPTHVRCYSEREWLELFEGAGLRVVDSRRFDRRVPLEPWLDRVETPAGERARIRELLGARVDGDTVAMATLVIMGRKGKGR